MKVLGNGVDIVSNSRIKKAITNYNFIKRIYSSSEIKGSKKILNKTNFFAKRFAAKEAVMKTSVLSLLLMLSFVLVGAAQETTPVYTVSSIQNDSRSTPIADMLESVMEKTPAGF